MGKTSFFWSISNPREPYVSFGKIDVADLQNYLACMLVVGLRAFSFLNGLKYISTMDVNFPTYRKISGCLKGYALSSIVMKEK